MYRYWRSIQQKVQIYEWTNSLVSRRNHCFILDLKLELGLQRSWLYSCSNRPTHGNETLEREDNFYMNNSGRGAWNVRVISLNFGFLFFYSQFGGCSYCPPSYESIGWCIFVLKCFYLLLCSEDLYQTPLLIQELTCLKITNMISCFIDWILLYLERRQSEFSNACMYMVLDRTRYQRMHSKIFWINQPDAAATNLKQAFT